MNNLPNYISLGFAITTLLSILLFYKAAHQRKIVLIVLLGWMAIQSVVALSGFYLQTKTVPPRFMLLILPPLLAIIMLFSTARGRLFIDSLDKGMLTLLHVVRIPVELVLLGLSIYKTIPGLMTFEGRNFDILSGISALLIYFFLFARKKYNRRALLVWNIVCLALLVNIVSIAILSAPFTFQRLAFDQPNIAVLYFPFIWLPAIVVPLVLLSHLASIRQLLKEGKSVQTNPAFRLAKLEN